MTDNRTQKLIEKLYLNEIFVADVDTQRPSIYKLNIDDIEMGSFKSSGILISTGTGSTGWLYSARQINPWHVQKIMEMLGDETSQQVSYTHLIISECIVNSSRHKPKEYL